VARPNPKLVKALAVELSAIAGFVDAVGYLTLHHVFTAHMTGNASKLGVALAHGKLLDAAPLALVPVVFVVAVAAGTIAVDYDRRWIAFALQCALVAVYMGYGGTVVHDGVGPAKSAAPFYVLLCLATAALGLQTALVTRVDDATVRTTYISGMLTRLGQTVSRRLRGRAHDDTPLELLIVIPIVYVAGATLGAWTLGSLDIWCLGIPVAGLAAATAVAYVV
jgi:uncharacterized membrane protein YoaK (UPF0700 family)